MDTMHPTAILVKWVYSHGDLTMAQRRTFLDRAEVAELAALPSAAVETAIAETPKLAEILVRARALAAEPTHAPKVAERPRSRWEEREPFEQPGDRHSQSRRRRDNGFRSNSGLDDALSNRSAGTVRRPGRTEHAPMYRCSSCGALIPAGAAHDC